MIVPRRCRPEEGKCITVEFGHRSLYIPSPTPPRRKLMLDSCSSEYDVSLRGTASGLPHPCAMDIISSVPVCQRNIKKPKSSAGKGGSVHENNPSKIHYVHL